MLYVPIFVHFGCFSSNNDLDCLGPSGRVVQEKMFCLQAAQLMFLLILNILLISAHFPLESLDSSFLQKACCQKILARTQLVAKTKATAVLCTCSRSAL